MAEGREGLVIKHGVIGRQGCSGDWRRSGIRTGNHTHVAEAWSYGKLSQQTV